jgi:hypothetical protein
MRTLILVLGATLALGGCSTFGKEKTPVCDGKHRRPANLYGSVLNPPSPPAAPPGPASNAVPPSAPVKPDLRSALSPSGFPSCNT